MAASDVNTAMASAQAALAAGNYATALDHAIAAQGYLAALPDSQRSGDHLRWDFNKIQAFIGNLRKRQTAAAAASGGIQRTKITYQRPSTSSL